MQDELLNVILNGITAIIVAVIGLFGILINRKINKVRDQVENGHDTNMREEQDVRHLENSQSLDLLVAEIPKMRKSVTKIKKRLTKHTTQIRDIEDTMPHDEVQEQIRHSRTKPINRRRR